MNELSLFFLYDDCRLRADFKIDYVQHCDDLVEQVNKISKAVLGKIIKFSFSLPNANVADNRIRHRANGIRVSQNQFDFFFFFFLFLFFPSVFPVGCGVILERGAA
jgi:hypothetical protein